MMISYIQRNVEWYIRLVYFCRILHYRYHDNIEYHARSKIIVLQEHIVVHLAPPVPNGAKQCRARDDMCVGNSTTPGSASDTTMKNSYVGKLSVLLVSSCLPFCVVIPSWRTAAVSEQWENIA